MVSKSEDPAADITIPAGHGVLVVSRNGEVIRYDSTGLVMRLSDKVIADIALRLGGHIHGSTAGTVSDALANPRPDAGELLEDIDAWDLRQQGDWLYFTAHLPGHQGVRGFRRKVAGGAILADAPGPLYAILALGGPRAALANLEPSKFPHYVLAPADDIGAVGHAGVERARHCAGLETLREVTHESLVAEALLAWQLEKFAPLRLFMTRAETDSSAKAADFAKGKALENLLVAAENLVAAAADLGKRPEVFCVCLDYALEDVQSTATAFRDAMLDVMAKVEAGFAKLGLPAPLFVARMESGLQGRVADGALAGQWELGWNHGAHRFLFSAPAYMFAQDAYARPSPQARREMAEMTAAAVSGAAQWLCPTFYLAERSQKDLRVIRLVARAASNLVIDLDDPLAAGANRGFALLGAPNSVQIVAVEIDPDDPQTVLLRLSRAIAADAVVQVAYAYALPEPAANAGGPVSAEKANTGAIRDDWQLESATGRILHRWALPCLLPVTAGGGNV